MIGWGLPAFLSFRAIESPGVQDDVQWLTYWVVFGFLNFVETFALRLVLYYLPFYFAFKTVFLLWLQLPQFRVSVSSRGGLVFESASRMMLHFQLKLMLSDGSRNGRDYHDVVCLFDDDTRPQL